MLTESEDADALLGSLIVELLIAATRAADDEPVQHLCCSAAGAPPCRAAGPTSVWDMAARAAQPSAPPDPTSAALPTMGRVVQHRPRVDQVRREGVRVVVRGLAYPSNRWTEERAERERIRRAKQVVPKPGAAAKVFRIGKGA